MTPSSLLASGSSYDETPYPSTAFVQTHPHRLCAMARLFGLNAPDPDRARVLELGCADGANLLPMAQHAPAAQFLGIDASARQVAQGQAAIAATRLTNVALRVQDILEFSPAEGKFDYIIAHGVFSWVPEAVRAKILAICQDQLAADGVAYISYNAFPGWSMRMALRDMMLFHTASLPDPRAKVAQGRALTAFLAETVPAENNPFGVWLQQEVGNMKGRTDGYLRHDILGEMNQPFYFFQFMELAGRAGLQYLSEPSLEQMLTSNLPPKVAETLDRVGGSFVGMEQYMDFLRNRNFRQTLLCHRDVKLERKIAPERMKSFHYTSLLVPPAPGALDLRPGVTQRFELRTDTKVTIDTGNSMLKAAFDTLAHCATGRISFAELLAAARQKSVGQTEPAARSDAAGEEALLAQHLLQLYTRGVVEIHAAPLRLRTSSPERPVATPLARYEALHAATVTNLAHRTITLDAVGRQILAACDGEKDVGAIMESLVAAIMEGKLWLTRDNAKMTDPGSIRKLLLGQKESLLQQITNFGFFAE